MLGKTLVDIGAMTMDEYNLWSVYESQYDFPDGYAAASSIVMAVTGALTGKPVQPHSLLRYYRDRVGASRAQTPEEIMGNARLSLGRAADGQ